MKHPFRWIALGVGVLVAVLAVILAVNVSTDPRADFNTSRLLGKAAPYSELHLSFLAAYRLEKGTWRFVAWQSCKLPDPATPAKP